MGKSLDKSIPATELGLSDRADRVTKWREGVRKSKTIDKLDVERKTKFCNYTTLNGSNGDRKMRGNRRGR